MTDYIAEPEPDRKSLPTRGLQGSPAVWIQQKKARDAELWGTQTSKYWIVENKLYDLSSFLDKHPGGRSWLTLTQGQDITDYFIIHHLNQDKARKQLQKYYVQDTKNKISRFSYEEHGLYRTVKRKVLSKMTVQEIRNQSSSKKSAIVILSLFFIFLGLAAITIDVNTNSKTPYIFCSLCSVMLIGVLGIGHNFIHHKNNNFKYFFLLTGFTHDQWQSMHCLSHHLYPNTELDFEAASLEPIGYFLRNKPANKTYTELILISIFILLQPLNLALKLVIVPILKKKMPILWYGIPLCVYFLFYYVSGDSWTAFKLHFFLYGLFGFLLNRTLFCGHRVQQLWTQGSQRIQDFGEHTMASSSDTDVGLQGFFSLLLLGGFNIHTPHHFFPTADHAVLPKILQIIDETCKQMNIKHTTNTRISCLQSISRGILKRIPYQSK